MINEEIKEKVVARLKQAKNNGTDILNGYFTAKYGNVLLICSNESDDEYDIFFCFYNSV